MKHLLLTIIALSGLGSAAAQDISYMWAELSYEKRDFDNGADLDGGGVEFNFHLDDRFYIPASFVSGGLDFDLGPTPTADFWDLGLGYHRPVSANGDLIVELKYLDADFDEGASLLAGFRHQLNDLLESRVTLAVADVNDTIVTLEGGVLLELWNEFGLTVDAQVDDEDDWGAGVGLRWSF